MVITLSVPIFQALKSFQLQVEVDPRHHPKIIGRKGAVISKIRADHDVNVQFPDRNEENQSIITITGYEQNAERAREEILSIVKDLVGSHGGHRGGEQVSFLEWDEIILKSCGRSFLLFITSIHGDPP